MREIVHVQTGQCGNQIGAKFWEVSCTDDISNSCPRKYLSLRLSVQVKLRTEKATFAQHCSILALAALLAVIVYGTLVLLEIINDLNDNFFSLWFGRVSFQSTY
jgi:hypothetical protein